MNDNGICLMCTYIYGRDKAVLEQQCLGQPSSAVVTNCGR